MSSLGTFGSFTTARLGIYASQMGLNVTGNNISNINTVGYTRQRLDQISLSGYANDRYQSRYDVRAGRGPLCTGISQIRDPYLDIRYRTESATAGYLDSMLSGLESLQGILDEVADGGEQQDGVIEAQLMDLLNCLNSMASEPNNTNEKLVRLAADTLVRQLNSYANRLDQVQKDTEGKLSVNMASVNSLLNRIAKLNESICKSNVHGDQALELRDERNRLIDELSQYIKIDVEYSMEDIGGGTEVEKLTIKLGNANPDRKVDTDSAVLVSGQYATQIGITQLPKPNPGYDSTKPETGTNLPYLDENGDPANSDDAALIDDPNFGFTLSALTDAKGRVDAASNGGKPVTLDDNDVYGSLQALRELLTESGDFALESTIQNVDENAAIKRGIPYYRNCLDLFARQLAEAFNKANTGYAVNTDGHYVDTDGKELTTGMPAAPFGPPLDNLNDDQKKALTTNGIKLGGNLFSNSGVGDDGENITAANISISKSWSTGNIHIVNTFQHGVGGTVQDNVLHMVTLLTQKQDFIPNKLVGNSSGDPMFNGTFAEMFGNIGTDLGKDILSNQTMLSTSSSTQVELDSSRDAVSGVDLNDEAANLMQYSKSYSAACRLLTTLDEVLDKLINGTGVAGR